MISANTICTHAGTHTQFQRPMLRLTYDQLDTLLPVWLPGDVTSRLIETSEPARNVLRLDTTHVTFVVVTFLVKSSCTTSIRIPFVKDFGGILKLAME